MKKASPAPAPAPVVDTQAELRRVATRIVDAKRGIKSQGVEAIVAATALTGPELIALAASWLETNPEPRELPELTARQYAFFLFFKEQQRQSNTTPTVRELGSHFNITSPNGVVCHLKALERKGVLYKLPGSTSRNWRITPGY